MTKTKRNEIPEKAPTTFREVTVGGSLNRRVTPRIVSPGAVLAFKRSMGVCLTDGCRKIAGHESDHT